MNYCTRRLAIAASVLLAGQAFAFLPPANPPLPNFDSRNVQAVQEATLPSEQAAGLSELRAAVPTVKVDFEPVTRAPKQILSHDGFLSGPMGLGRAISAASLAALPVNDPNRATKAFLAEHSRLFGYGPE